MNNDEIRQIIHENEIRWIQIHFTDLFGKSRVLHIPANRFLEDDILEHGIGFDGSSIGLANVEKSDMIAIPDAKTFLVLPHETDEAMILADIYDASIQKSSVDPRRALKNAVKTVNENGFNAIKISPEIEFFVLEQGTEDSYNINSNEGYFCPPPLDNAKKYRKTLSDLLIDSKYNVKYQHHENGKYQHEIEIKSLDAVDAADFCIYFKYLAREVANRNDMQVTFMPKLFSQESGNGMHAHVSIYKNGENMFLDKNDEYNLSQTARYFIGGLLKHSRSIAAIANPTVNSYKRLVPHFEAPIYIAWAQYNRSSLIRIAAKKNIDVEIRNADPLANPYLFFAAIIHAGFDGIKKKIEYRPVEKNIYKMTKEELKSYGIDKLPSNLLEALEELENDDTLKQAIGRTLIETYIEKKKEEWKQYMSEISELDHKYYFNY